MQAMFDTLHCPDCEQKTDNRILIISTHFDGQQWQYSLDQSYGYCCDCENGFMGPERYTPETFADLIARLRKFNELYRPLPIGQEHI